MHPCATCATIQRTCCQRAQIVVTDGDIARIALHSGRDDFWHHAAPLSQEYAEPDPDDPNWLRYTLEPDGTRRVLRRSEAAGCTFLGENGCVLPEGVRPLVCRLYPWAYNEEGMAGIDDEYCPTQVLAPAGSGRTMLTVLGMSPAQGQAWRAQLYAELRERAVALGRVDREISS